MKIFCSRQKNCLKFYLFCFLLGGIFFAVAAQDRTSTSEGEEEFLSITNDRLQDYTESTLSSSALAHLKQIGLDVNTIGRLPVPKNWQIEWESYPRDCVISGGEAGFCIQSPSAGVRMYGSLLETLNNEYRIEFTLASLGKAEADVDLGIYAYGMVNSGRHIIQKIHPPLNSSRTYRIEMKPEDQYSSFRPMIAVQGGVRIENVRIWRRPVKGYIVVEGMIKERSILPDPRKSDYPNCRFTARFVGNSILSGKPCCREIALAIDGFREYRLQKSDELKPGMKVRLTMIPFDQLPKNLQSVQQADDLSLFMLDNYFVTAISPIDCYQDSESDPKSGILFSDIPANYVSIFKRQINPPIPESVIAAQRAAIAADLVKMNVLLSDFDLNRDILNQNFQNAWEAEQKKDEQGYNRIDHIVWRNINHSFWALPEKYVLVDNYPKLSTSHLNALISLKGMLEANGVQLIVSLVPYFYDIAARVINPDFRNVPDYRTALLVKLLSEAGIETIYASDEIIENYNKYPFAFFFPNNSHPSDTSQDILADIVSKRLARYHFLQTLDHDKFSFAQAPHCYGDQPRYRFPVNCDIGTNHPESYTNREVLYQNQPINNDEKSPVMIFGNSFMQTPMAWPPSFPSLLASKINLIPDFYQSGGYGPMITIMQNLFANPTKFLKGKKVVILQIGTVHCDANLSWNDLSVMDHFQALLAGKTLVCTFHVSGQKIPEDQGVKMSRDWNSFEGKCEYLQSGKEPVEIINIECNDEIDPGKKIICVIPCVIPVYSNAQLIVNGQGKPLPAYYSTIRWQNLVFELPSGTKALRVSALGLPNTRFAIKDIMIYQ